MLRRLEHHHPGLRLSGNDLQLRFLLALQHCVIAGHLPVARRQVQDAGIAVDLQPLAIAGKAPGHRRFHLLAIRAIHHRDHRHRGGGGDGHHLLQGLGQFAGIVGGQKAATRRLGDALHLHQGLGLAADIEADHMGGKVYACLLQRAGGGAGIGVAGLDPVRDQDDRRRLFGMAQRLGGEDDRIGHRRHAARVQPVDRLGDQRGGAGRGRHDQLDIGALAALAVAIGDEAQILPGREIGEDPGHHLAGDGDLVHPVDLPPHRTRSIQHQDGGGPFLRRCRRRQAGGSKGQHGQRGSRKGCHAVSPWRDTGAALPPAIRPFNLRKCPDICSSRASHSGSGDWPSMARK